MPKPCDHEPPETKRGIGPCRIEAEVKLRNGKPNWWCRVHGQAAGAPDGSALESCPGSWFDEVAAESRLELTVGEGEFAIWGALPPAIRLGTIQDETGRVHVHHRQRADAAKDIDRSFDIVTVRHRDRELVIEGVAAIAASISELSGRETVALTCPHCQGVHLDELKFATRPHAKHLCNSCGRNFRDRVPSISNPLATAHPALGLTRAESETVLHRPLELRSSDYAGIAIWPSNTAIVSTMSRSEEVGLHVHACDSQGRLVIDETFSAVCLDDAELDSAAVRLLTIQRALAHGAPIVRLACQHCGTSLTGSTDNWIEPTTQHACACGGQTRTRLRSFVNPLAA